MNREQCIYQLTRYGILYYQSYLESQLTQLTSLITQFLLTIHFNLFIFSLFIILPIPTNTILLVYKSQYSFIIMIGILHLLVIISLLTTVYNEKNYTDAVLKLKAAIKDPQGDFYHKSYQRLANFSDTFGPRMWGSESLELAINDLYQQALKENFDNIRLEPVSNFTSWVRGHQSLTLHSPRSEPWPIKMIGLGWTIPCNITGQVIVIRDWEDLQNNKDNVKGKIVVYDQKWVNYNTLVPYRKLGASRAAQYGALAALVSSVTPDSIQSVHTGSVRYDTSMPKVCTAAISTQDAQMFRRMQNRNQTIVLHLQLQNKNQTRSSSNLVFEIKGSTYPEQIFLMGGHIDSWDTGSQTGANDDGGGFMTVFDALRLLKKNGLVPKRTLRFIAWSGQQFGAPDNGAKQYLKLHAQEVKNHIVAFESDLGSTNLLGFGIEGSSQGLSLLKNITSDYLSLIGVNVANQQGEAVDILPLYELGVPMMANVVQDSADHRFYFTYHHTAGDSMTIMDPQEMDSNVLGIASLFYILADLDVTVQPDNPPK